MYIFFLTYNKKIHILIFFKLSLSFTRLYIQRVAKTVS